MAEWGRKEYAKAWPSRRPVWTMAAVFATMLVFAGLLTVQYERSWTAAQGLYWKDYLKSGTRGQGWAYCLMPNHVHLILVPAQADGLGLAVGEAHRRSTNFINARGR